MHIRNLGGSGLRVSAGGLEPDMKDAAKVGFDS
jgi:hypothetical protein